MEKHACTRALALVVHDLVPIHTGGLPGKGGLAGGYSEREGGGREYKAKVERGGSSHVCVQQC